MVAPETLSKSMALPEVVEYISPLFVIVLLVVSASPIKTWLFANIFAPASLVICVPLVSLILIAAWPSDDEIVPELVMVRFVPPSPWIALLLLAPVETVAPDFTTMVIPDWSFTKIVLCPFLFRVMPLFMVSVRSEAVSYTHLTLPTIYSV